MDTQEKQLIKEAYQNLPPVMQTFVTTSGLEDLVSGISREFSLTQDQAAELEDEATMFLLGILPPKYFLSGVSDRLDIEREVGWEIVKRFIEGVPARGISYLREINGIDGDLLEAIRDDFTPPIIPTPVDDVLGTYKKTPTEESSVLIRPTHEGIDAARVELSKPVGYASRHEAPAPPQNLPGAISPAPVPRSTLQDSSFSSDLEPLTPRPATPLPTPQPASAYPVPQVPSNTKTAPSDDTADEVTIPENIFEAKLRQVSQSLEGHGGEAPRPPAPKPPIDPYREPIG
jgi:hypothetical protein